MYISNVSMCIKTASVLAEHRKYSNDLMFSHAHFRDPKTVNATIEAALAPDAEIRQLISDINVLFLHANEALPALRAQQKRFRARLNKSLRALVSTITLFKKFEESSKDMTEEFTGQWKAKMAEFTRRASFGWRKKEIALFLSLIVVILHLVYSKGENRGLQER